MAHPIGFGEANSILAASPGVPNCTSLEVFRDGKYCVSRWQLTDQEIAELKRNGGKVYVLILGATQPPVAIAVETPFEHKAP
jgi:hypothetical protein